ncbi:hypothetical protein SD70_25860 [Gordoniibacillus kamchatkensis]|uniref:GP-PDE domain-containing protein n=1 Tax=Gordoniibacillus kamchatkensis TaxID=1590651 RepID=A0ABR5AC28_9BACL|nr:glycerophosphodiester phosphodiesterase [Paenibacillus sp. VKM B-2647]KIL38552.1 hypothetical protein SD70_25860 [Paenibacillus sp. VKM B-2647]
MAQFPLITAHSGCMNTLDNTLESVETGLRLGADVVEEDIRVTRDGIAVLAHDDAWETVDGRECRISQLTYADLSELTIAARHGERIEPMRIIRLEDILPEVKASGRIVNLDLKTDDSLEPVAQLVRKYGLLEQAILSGCERDRALLAQRTHPELTKLLNTDTKLFMAMPYDDAMAQTCQDALDASCIGININHLLVRPELMSYAESLGLPVYVWTVNEEPLMRHFIQLGVRSMTTRNVLALVRLKRELQGEADQP